MVVYNSTKTLSFPCFVPLKRKYFYYRKWINKCSTYMVAAQKRHWYIWCSRTETVIAFYIRYILQYIPFLNGIIDCCKECNFKSLRWIEKSWCWNDENKNSDFWCGIPISAVVTLYWKWIFDFYEISVLYLVHYS